MPCIKCRNGKYKFGSSGTCRYSTLADCEKANRGKNKHTPRHKPKRRRRVYGMMSKLRSRITGCNDC